MTRRRSSALGRRPARRRSLPLLSMLLMLVVAACGEGSSPTADLSPTDALPTESAEASTDTPSEEPSPSDTDEPDPSESAEATETPEPTDDASAEPAPSDGSGSAGACAGNDDNRLFYARVAAAVDWPVFCPVLPAGWFVEKGEYKSAGGGWMTIAYKGPGGARLELSEGHFCSSTDGCVPDGTDAGPSPFGSLAGTLVMGSDGRNSVVVDRGSSPSWLAIGTGLDVEVFTELAADLVPVVGE